MKNTIWMLAFCAVPAFGQMQDNREPKMTCDDRNHGNRTGQHCEIKETTIPALSRITVNGGANDGVTVRGGNRQDI